MFHVKIYVVQKPDGEVLAAKLTRATAQAVAKQHAPAKVTMVVADKEAPECQAARALAAAASHRRPAS